MAATIDGNAALDALGAKAAGLGTANVIPDPSVVAAKSDMVESVVQNAANLGGDSGTFGLYEQSEQETPNGFGLGATDFSVVGHAIAALGEERADRTVNPDFNGREYVGGTYKDKWDELLKEQGTDEGAQFILDKLTSGPENAQVVDEYFRRWDEYKERRQKVQDSGNFSYIMGGIAGMTVDTLGALLLGKGAGMSQVVANTKRMQRMLGASRAAKVTGVESGIDAYLESFSNIAQTDMDILLMAGFGTGAGALLGHAAPKFIGNVLNKVDIEKAALKRAEVDARRAEANAANRDPESGPGMGAATAVDDPMQELGQRMPTTGTGTLLAGKLVPRELRSPRRVVADWFAEGGRQFKKHKLEGNLHFGRIIQRVYQQSTLDADDGVSATGRLESLSQAFQLNQVELVTHEKVVDDLYAAFVKEELSGSAMQRMAQNQVLLAKSVGRVYGTKLPSKAEIRHAADLYAQEVADSAKEGPADIKGAMSRTMATLGDKVGDKQEAFQKIIKDIADKDDEMYLELGKREFEVGLIAEQPKLGYRPQIWNVEAVNDNMSGFQRVVFKILAKDVDDTWVNENFGRGVDADGNDMPFLEEGQTFAEFAKKNPDEALTIQDEWAEALKELQSEPLKRNLAKQQAIERSFVGQSAEDVLSDYQKIRTKGEKDLEIAAAKMEAARDIDDSAELLEQNLKMGRIEKKMGDAELRTRELRRLMREEGDLRHELFANSNRKARKELKLAAGVVRKATAKLAKKNAQLNANAAAAQITKAISGNDSAFGYIPDELIESSKHFKRRALDLKGQRMDPEVQKFLRKESSITMDQYMNATQRQVEIRRKFQPLLVAQGLMQHGDKDILKTLREFSLSQYDEDMLKIDLRDISDKAKAKLKSDINARRQEAGTYFDRAFGEITKSDYTMDPSDSARIGLNQAVSIAQAATAASGLGFVFASLLTDLAIVAMAGGRLGIGLVGLFRRGSQAGIWQDIAAIDEQLAMLIRGANTYDASMGASRLDIPDEVYMPGGMLGTIQRGINDVAVKEGWANMMHVWNRFVRGSFGLDFARQVSADLGEFDGLSSIMKSFYSKHGVGPTEAKKIGELMDKYHVVVQGIRLPDTKAWAANGFDLELRSYKRLIQSAGDEAMLDPQIGDRPFLKRYALGRLILQFQSFTYKAGNEWLSPMIQAQRINPGDVRPMMSGLLAITLAGAGNAARQYARGEEEGEEWRRGVFENGSQGFYTGLKEAYLRSPFSVGMAGIAMDTLGTHFAKPMNELSQAITGSDFKPMNEEWVRLRQRQGLAGLLGPAVGSANSAIKIGDDFMSGKFEDGADALARKIPIVNTMPIWALATLLKED